MSAMRNTGSASEGGYPRLSARDVLLNGAVTVFRNRAEQPFGDTDAIVLNEPWRDTANIESACERVMRKEASCAKKESFAWSPEFGYLSPVPEHCGAGMSICAEFHLEGLHLIGDLPLVLSGIDAVRFYAESISGDGIRDAAHLFRIANVGSLGISESDLARRAKAIFNGLLRQELNARRILVERDTRHFADAIYRALAILKTARLLSPCEVVDLLSPLRLAAAMGFIDGFTCEEATSMTERLLNRGDEYFPENEDGDRLRDRRDSRLADKANKRFASVSVNARGKEFLT